MLDPPNFRPPLAIALGAIAGALSRYYLGQWLATLHGGPFPLAVFVINLIGCFLMGAISTYALRRFHLHPDLLLLITTGFLGSFTTFSSYELDTANLLDLQGTFADLVYWMGSPLLGLACFMVGVALIRLTVTPQADQP
jgi:CrcB protein